MCGVIAGLFKGLPVSTARVNAALAALAHRGPGFGEEERVELRAQAVIW